MRLESKYTAKLPMRMGQRKKTVVIRAIVSSNLYECVASNVPGLDKHEEKSAYIILSLSDASVTQKPGGNLSPGTSTETDSNKLSSM